MHCVCTLWNCLTAAKGLLKEEYLVILPNSGQRTSQRGVFGDNSEKVMSPNLWAGNILILVWIPLALARHFLVCTISCEPVVGFLPNLHGYIIRT